MENKFKTTKIVLIILGVFVLFFTIGCLWLFWLYQAVPDSLIVAVFGAVFGEASILGWIKTIKTKYASMEDEVEE